VTDSAKLSHLILQGAQTATACTEPGAIALAAAVAAQSLGRLPEHIEVSVSSGVFKNALGVGLPGTSRKGPAVAAALGAAVGRAEAQLGILRDIVPDKVAAAHALLDQARVSARADYSRSGVFIHVLATAGGHQAEVTIDGGHCRFTVVSLDGKRLVSGQPIAGDAQSSGSFGEQGNLRALLGWPFARLVRAALAVPPDDCAYLRKGAASNLRLAETMVSCGYPIDTPLGNPPLGWRLLQLDSEGVSPPLSHKARSLVSAAVYARMAGVAWPVLTSAGSGNQGITLAIPIALAASAIEAAPQAQKTALVLAHATNLYIHAFVGEIAPVCGSTSAAAGVAAAVCWLLGGEIEQLEAAAQLVMGNLFGVICDGAKASCALKCATAASEGLFCGQWARTGVKLPQGVGITGASLADTLGLAQALVHDSLSSVDKVVIEARNRA